MRVSKGDAQKVVTIISGDKAKTQTYCAIKKLGEQIEEASAKKDGKTVMCPFGCSGCATRFANGTILANNISVAPSSSLAAAAIVAAVSAWRGPRLKRCRRDQASA
jgi:hypothetical protein